MVVEADGRILVAEQGRNRIVAIDPRTHAVTAWRTFTNRTTNEGIDGIGPNLPTRDASGQPLPNGNQLIVPDSPNGVVWEVSADGRSATQVASGMNRPVGAAVDRSGRIFVADEGGALWVLSPARRRFASLSTPDDVVVTEDGHLFVNTLGDNAIHELDMSGREVAVLRNLPQPQGLALDAAENLYYTLSTAGRIERVVRSFVLRPPKVTRIASHRFIVCPVISRAADFNQSLSLTTESSLSVDIMRLVQPGLNSSGALEIETANPSITITVGGLAQTISLPS
jgi:hypothetical protein